MSVKKGKSVGGLRERATVRGSIAGVGVGWLGLALLLAVGQGACSAVYPELATPVRAAPAQAKLEPEPPEDVLYIYVEKATIPERTRDGRQWDAVGGDLPDPFAKVFVDDVELFRTPVQSNTLHPTWPDSIRANYRIAPRTPMRFELWDDNALTHSPICMYQIRDIHQHASRGFIDIQCESGASASLVVAPAHAMFGLGLYYELRAQDVYVTRVLEESPAARAGLGQGIQIVSIQGESLHGKDAGAVRSLFNANLRTGLNLQISRPDGSTALIELKEGPIYPLSSEKIELK
jgi:hypothetical protein